MTNPRNDIESGRQLSAFADGELDAAAHARMVEHLATEPQAMRQVLGQQRLRQAVGRVMSQEHAQAPDALRQRLEALADSTTVEDDGTPPLATIGQEPSAGPRQGVLARMGRWMPAAVAALLFVSALVVLDQAGQRTPAVGDGTILPVSQVERFTRKHVRCSRGIQALSEAVHFPREIQALPDAVTQFLGSQPAPTLDLTAIGYSFAEAGRCSIPGQQSVHLIYRARPETGRSDALSLWLEPHRGQFEFLRPGQPYQITGRNAAHPMLVWRQGEMVYFLVGDNDQAIDHVVAHLTGSMP